ncbi:MAG: class I SAM-dependent methyltransferase [Cyclobacteriaceae bacterium]
MSIPNKPIHSSSAIVDFYTGQLNSHGDTSKGVGWKNDEAQNVRFKQLAKVIQNESDFSINDVGCGTSKFLDFLHTEGFSPSLYLGYDILEEMIEVSKKNHPVSERIKLKRIEAVEEISAADYSIASGIFNVKYDSPEYEWLHYVLSAIEAMNEKSRRGFAFNLLTKYSDKEFMQAYLYYADPLYFFDYCKRNFAKNVAILHDYDQYDFTIIVRKQ